MASFMLSLKREIQLLFFHIIMASVEFLNWQRKTGLATSKQFFI